MSEHPNEQDYANKAEREASYWRERCGEIASSLTSAQREALICEPEPYYGSFEAQCREPADLQALIDAGLTGDGWPDRMTELGCHVRAYLQEPAHD